MSRRRRRGNRRGGVAPTGARSGRGNRRSSPRKDNGARGRDHRTDGTTFWGDATALPTDPPEIRITDDAAAVPRSLGEPPLPGHREVAEHYFAAIYDRAVATAGALAAAGGLIDPDRLTDRGDHDA